MLYRLLEEEKEKNQNEVISYPVYSLPEMKIENKVKETITYINRRILSDELKLVALMLKYKDLNDDVTVFELSGNANVLAIGFLCGKIEIHLLNSKFEDLAQYLHG